MREFLTRLLLAISEAWDSISWSVGSAFRRGWWRVIDGLKGLGTGVGESRGVRAVADRWNSASWDAGHRVRETRWWFMGWVRSRDFRLWNVGFRVRQIGTLLLDWLR